MFAYIGERAVVDWIYEGVTYKIKKLFALQAS